MTKLHHHYSSLELHHLSFFWCNGGLR